MKRTAACFLMLFAFATFAKAGVFTAADALFEQRESGAAKIEAARAEYKALLNQVSGRDLAYAVQQLGRLAFYQGELLTPGDDTATRTTIFTDCRADVEKLAGVAEGKSQYHFWKLLCTAYWVKSAPLLSRLAQISGIKSYFESIVGDDLELRPELGLDTRYLGGGLYRVLGGIYSESLSTLVRSDLPNREKALELADRALGAAAFPGDPNAGENYYSNFRNKGDILVKLGRTDEAKAWLGSAIREIEDLASVNELPQGLGPETRAELALMKAKLAGL